MSERKIYLVMGYYTISDSACPNLVGFRYKLPSTKWIKVNRLDCVGSNDFLQDYMNLKRLKFNDPDNIRLYAIYSNGKEHLIK